MAKESKYTRKKCGGKLTIKRLNSAPSKL